MAKFTSEEIATVLRTAELLHQKGVDQRINISKFCKDAGISRKNAYKHKRKIDKQIRNLKEEKQHLERKCQAILEKLHCAEKVAREVDITSGVNEVLFEAVKHNIRKKNLIGTPEQKKLINDYNKIADSHGLERLPSLE